MESFFIMENWGPVVSSGITALGAIIVGWISYGAKKHAKNAHKQAAEANDAVNHRHPNNPKLYDAVLQNSHDIGEIKADVKDVQYRIARVEANFPIEDKDKDADCRSKC